MRGFKFTLRQLEVFVAVGRYENVSRAAEQLALSQSAVSMALNELERQFETQLFDRYGKRLHLNEHGRQLLGHAMDFLDRGREIESLLKGETGIGPLRMGATLTIGNYLAPSLIGQFLQQYPDCRIQLEVRNTASIVRDVANFELDFGLVEGDVQHKELSVTHWINDEMAIFTTPNHPLAKRTHLSLQDLLDVPWIVREQGSGTRQTFERALRKVLPELDIRLELEHTEGIKRAVESGLGIGCVSRLALRDAFQRGSLVELRIPDLSLRRKFYIVLHQQKFRTPGIEKFLALCRAKATSLTLP